MGTDVVIEVLVAAETALLMPLNSTRLFAAVVLKFVPAMDTLVPGAPIVGEKDEIVGACEAATVNDAALAADPPGEVTPIVPVVAPLGTVAVNCVVVAAETLAPVPLKVTVFCDGVDEKPVPEMSTVVPIGPLPGEKVMMETWEDA